MIEIKAKVHDKFAVEFKVGFVADGSGRRDNTFAINTWIFVPNSLDINPATYGKEDFYRDVKSNVRMITPVFSLHDVAGGDAVPVKLLRQSLDALKADNTKERSADYEYHVKMFAAITKSALRDETYMVEDCTVAEDAMALGDGFVDSVHLITVSYRGMADDAEAVGAGDFFSFGDEFISHLISSYAFRILARLDALPVSDRQAAVRGRVFDLIRAETAYKRRRGYVTVSGDDPAGNRRLVYRHNVLKKYISSDLYIRLDKKEDGRAVRQLYYSIAAGVAMIFATVIAFSFQRKFGNFSGPLFVALVVSYMLKDRIKDLMRYYFAHRLGRKYFDHKAAINIKEYQVGWLKEAMDFISEEHLPAEIAELRGRIPLVAAENRFFDEKIILYRKLVYIDGEELARYNEYRIDGINDILRININRFTLKMDDPQVALRMACDDGTTKVVYTDKIYYINILMQFRYGDTTEYRRFRLVVNRNGIQEIEDMSCR